MQMHYLRYNVDVVIKVYPLTVSKAAVHSNVVHQLCICCLAINNKVLWILCLIILLLER